MKAAACSWRVSSGRMPSSMQAVSAISIGPPICITPAEVDEIVHALDLSLWEVEGELGVAQTA